MKLTEARRDLYRRLAKEEGYRSRAAFKLIEIQRRYRVLKRGDIVLDVGCAPGGWLQVASKAVGLDGFVLGVDLRDVEPPARNVATCKGDICAPETLKSILSLLPSKCDVVLSDLSPNVSGVWELDHLKQIDMTRCVISFLPDVLRKRGSAVLKMFEGEMLTLLLKELKGIFGSVWTVKPEASRRASSEVYIVCLGYLG